jgi:hypothetical protein
MAWAGTTYLSLQQQIADELGDRQDLMNPLSDSGETLSPIQNAIQSAITKWEREPFYFNEFYSDPLFTAVAGQEYYNKTTSPVAVDFTGISNITKIRVLINNNRYVLNARTPQYIEDISVNPSVQSEFPIDFSFYASTMRFYPIPDQNVPVTIMDNQRLGVLAQNGDSNAWITEGYDLIRCEAKLVIALEVLFDDDLATRMNKAIYGSPTSPFLGQQQTQGYLYALKAETTRRAPGRIRPSHF